MELFPNCVLSKACLRAHIWILWYYYVHLNNKAFWIWIFWIWSIHSGWSWDLWLRAPWHMFIIWPAPEQSTHMKHTFKHIKYSCLVIYTHMRCISPAHGVLMSSLKIQTYKLYNLALAINPLNNCFPLYRVNTSNNKLISMIIKDNK